jgi:hypothetical protein
MWGAGTFDIYPSSKLGSTYKGKDIALKLSEACAWGEIEIM